MWLGILLAMGLLAIVLAQLVEDRVKTRNEAIASAANVSRALATDIHGSISVLERILMGVRDAVAAGDENRARLQLEMIMLAMPDAVKVAGTTDAAGRIILGNPGGGYESLNLSWRPYFAHHKDNPDRSVYFSGPFAALTDGTPMLVLSLRLEDKAGKFSGVAVAGIKLSYFNTLFERINVERGGSLTLFTKQGTLLGRRPFDPQLVGRDLSKAPALVKIMRGETVFEEIAMVDNVERLYVSTPIADYPLFINVAQATETIYQHWTAKTVIIGLTTSALVSGMIFLIWMFHSENCRRGTMQAELADANRQLHETAETDALTGVANRRRVDRLLREQQAGPIGEMSVLMLDIDLFKNFNDHYGHGAGDTALQHVANAIAHCVRGEKDIVARYGGEEFIVLLPGAPGGAAQMVAERIRRDVAALAIPHAQSPFGTVTVSIGVASVPENPDCSIDELVRQADQALYRSKQSGRNQINAAIQRHKANDSASAREVA
jgi:diguanylate cyclase (GGDEF)-like protein